MRTSFPIVLGPVRCGAALLAIVLAGQVGCGGSGGGGSAGTGGSGGSGGGGGSAGTGGSVSYGLVSFDSGGDTHFATGQGAYTLQALFEKAPGSGSIPGGPQTGCKVVSTKGGGSGSNVDVTFVSAGTMTFDDGSSQLASVAYNSTLELYEYDSTKHASLAWKPGDTLKVSASGATFPAFSQSITAPQYVTGIHPTIAVDGNVTQSVSSAFTLSWTKTSDDGVMELEIGNSATAVLIDCVAEESAGSVTIQPADLQMVGTGSGMSISLQKTVTKRLTVSGATVDVEAQTPSIIGTLTLD